MLKIMAVIFILLMPSIANSYSYVNFNFSAYQNNIRIYDISYTAKSVSENIYVETKITGNDICEFNYCVLEKDLVKKIYQKSQNNIENLHYEWRVDSDNFFYLNIKNHNVSSGNIKLDSKSQSLQSLIYVLLNVEIKTNLYMYYKLIAPPNQIYQIVIKPIGLENIELNGEIIPCWKLEIGLDGIFGIFFPKWHYWASKKKPHIPLKYKNGDTVVYLTSFKIEG